jgi:uncharacterized OsmC-like protein
VQLPLGGDHEEVFVQTHSTRLDETVEKLTADPSAGVTMPSVTATVLNGHARLSSGPFNWESDLGPAVGGQNLAPSPTAYLLGALAGCGVIFLRDTLAPQFGVTLDGVEATASCQSDVGGLVGIEGRDPALQQIRLSITVTSADPTDRVEAMFAAWRERCPIYLSLLNPNSIAVDLEQSARGG